MSVPAATRPVPAAASPLDTAARPVPAFQDRPSGGVTSHQTGTERDIEALGDEIARLAAQIHAATYRLLVLIGEFDACEGWGNGFRSCADWLSWRTGIAPGAARERVRVARALADLPLVSAEMQSGAMSFSKARAITRVATPENEAELVELSRHATAAHLERIVRAWRRVDRLEEAEAEVEAERHLARELTLHRDADGSFVLRARLDPEVGAVLEKALEWAEGQLFRRGRAEEDSSANPPTAGQRRADALGLLAELALGSEDGARRADRYQVVLHVGPSGAAGTDATGRVGGAPLPSGAGAPDGLFDVSAETSRRLACDAGIVVMSHDSGGRALDVGRRSRTVPPALRRALEARGRHCRFPGCRVRHTDAHHIRHWAEGGQTRLDNLVLLCRRHHRLVHEEGWRVRLDETGAALFTRPDGTPLPRVPSPPEIGTDPVGVLRRTHRAEGIDPDGWLTTPDWGGERLDLALAVEGLIGGGASSSAGHVAG